MPTPTLRLATPADIPELVELRIAMQMEVSGDRDYLAKPSDLAAYSADVRRYFAESLPAGSYVGAVAEIDGALVSANGLIVYRKPPGIGGGSGKVGYVSNVYTRPAWRGRGIAEKLLKVLVEHAREANLEKLHLGTTELGKSVYERVGFRAPKFTPLDLRLV